MNKLIALASTAALAGSAFAYDLYRFTDALGDHDIANRENWTLNGSVPDTFPPALDTATSGSTHPQMHFDWSGEGTNALPNSSELTMQCMIFNFSKYNTDWLIDLGDKSKTIKLFGDCDAMIWVGGNSPDGSRVTLKRGTITRVQSSQRNTAIRLGANAQGTKRLSYFRVDGPDALVKDAAVSIQSDDCEFCVTNGGTATVTGGYSLRMNQRLPDARYIVSGKGSLLQSTSTGAEGFFFGDGISYPDRKAGGVVINDGGAVSGANGAIGNRAGNFYALVDNGYWTNANHIVLSASGDGTSTNNTFTAQNKSTISLSGSFTVGSFGGYDSALVTNCALFKANAIILGAYPYGSVSAGYGYNTMTLVDTPFSVGTVSVGGHEASNSYPNEGPNAYNNSLEIRNCEYTGSGTISVLLGSQHGGTNRLVLADGTYPLSSAYVGRAEKVKGFGGYNTLLVTNCVVRGGFEVGGGGGVTTSGTDGNVISFFDTTFDGASTFHIGNSSWKSQPACSNRIELVRSAWTNDNTYMGIGGWTGSTRGRNGNALILDDHAYADSTKGGDGVRLGGYGIGNRLEVKNGSTFLANGIYNGYTHSDWRYSGTNVLYVGKDALVSTPNIYQPSPGGNILIIEDGTFKARYLQLHYYYSDAASATKDSMPNAEAEYEKTAREIWGSRFIFRGTHPVLRCPYNDATSGSITGCEFDRSCIVEFEFPETPYAQGVLQSAYKVSFAAGTNYRFDFSKAARTSNWADYKLAEVDNTGWISFGTGEFARMTEAMKSAAEEAGLRVKLALSDDKKTLTASTRSIRGLIITIR